MKDLFDKMSFNYVSVFADFVGDSKKRKLFDEYYDVLAQAVF